MEKIKAALYVYVKSLTSVQYYNEIIQTSTKFSLKYYVALALIFTLITSLSLSLSILPRIERGINQVIDHTLGLVEEDLVITIEEGVMSINKEEPYIVPANGVGGVERENLLVIDSEGTLEDLEQTYDTFVLINSVNIIVQMEEETIVQPLRNLPDGTYSREDLESAISWIQPLLSLVPYLVGFMLVLGVLMYYLVFRLLYLFLVAVVLGVLGLFRDLGLGYKKYYQIAIHSMTLPLTLELLRNTFSLDFHFPYWFIITNILFGAVVVLKLDVSGKDLSSGVDSTDREGEDSFIDEISTENDSFGETDRENGENKDTNPKSDKIDDE